MTKRKSKRAAPVATDTAPNSEALQTSSEAIPDSKIGPASDAPGATP